MGKKKKDKDARQQRKERQAAKQEKKNAKKGQKLAKKAGDDDIDALLREFEEKEAAKTAVTVFQCEPPSPRSNFSLTALSSSSAILFGGDFFDGIDSKTFNDLYIMQIGSTRDVTWTKIESPSSPLPRGSHQAVIYRDFLYVFGGEFTTSTQFHHYGDFWRLHLKSNSWEQLSLKGSAPSARSGHRMCVWRHYLVLFGGFYDAARGTRWFDDLFVMSFTDFIWRQVDKRPLAPHPAPRSGFGMALHTPNDSIFVFGGYSQSKDSGKKDERQLHNDVWALRLRALAQPGGLPTWERISRKGAAPSPRSGFRCATYKTRALIFGGVADTDGPRYSLISTFYSDLHAYDMSRCRYYELQTRAKAETGRRRRRKADTTEMESHAGGALLGNAKEQVDDDDDDGVELGEEEEETDDPNDAHFGFWDDKGEMVFLEDDGGEDDQDEDSETKSCEAEISQLDISLGPTPVASEALPPAVVAPSSNETENHDVEARGESVQLGEDPEATMADMEASLGEDRKEETPVAGTAEGFSAKAGDAVIDAREGKPCARISAGMAVLGNKLVLYGGIAEDGDREVTMDDLWVLDLSKRQGWEQLLEGTFKTQEWKGEDDQEDDEPDDLNSDEFDSDESELDEDEQEEEEEEEKEREQHDERTDDLEEGKDAAATVSASADRSHEQTTEADMLSKISAEADEAEEATKKKKQKKKKSKDKQRAKGLRARIQELHEQLSTDDAGTTPSAGETCRDFFARTSEVWVRKLLDDRPNLAEDAQFSEKELRRDAFSLAQSRYAELEPILSELDELEREQNEAEREALEAVGNKRGKR